jgi:hypothetical protein
VDVGHIGLINFWSVLYWIEDDYQEDLSISVAVNLNLLPKNTGEEGASLLFLLLGERRQVLGIPGLHAGKFSESFRCEGMWTSGLWVVSVSAFIDMTQEESLMITVARPFVGI